jgi:hypothetical protein
MPNSNFSRGLRAFGSAVCDAHDAGWARNILGTLQRFVSDHAGIAALLDNRSDTRCPSQAVSTEKRSAQKAVVVLLFPKRQRNDQDGRGSNSKNLCLFCAF